MIKPDRFEEQIIFYCKGWFESPDENILTCLKAIIGGVAIVESKYLSDYDVYRHMLKTAFKCCSINSIQNRFEYIFARYGVSIEVKHMIKELYGVIQDIQVENSENNKILIELTEPDYTLLPKRKER